MFRDHSSTKCNFFNFFPIKIGNDLEYVEERHESKQMPIKKNIPLKLKSSGSQGNAQSESSPQNLVNPQSSCLSNSPNKGASLTGTFHCFIV